MQTPGPVVRGFVLAAAPFASEPDVEASTEEVGVERRVAGRRETAIETAIEIAEIDIKVLGLHAHIADHADLEPDAEGPAGVAVAAAGQSRPRRADIPGRKTAGDVGHEAVEGVAEAAARGDQPLVARLAAGGTQHVRGALDPRPVDVAFGAQHDLVDLPVVADGAADKAAGDVERVDAVPPRRTPAAATVDTEIEPRPVVDGGVVLGRRRRPIARDVGAGSRPGRRARQGQKACARNNEAFHDSFLRQDRLPRTVLLNFLQSSARKPHRISKYLITI